jgi:hypothetical protein
MYRVTKLIKSFRLDSDSSQRSLQGCVELADDESIDCEQEQPKKTNQSTGDVMDETEAMDMSAESVSALSPQTLMVTAQTISKAPFRRRVSQSPFVIRKNRQGSTTKWVPSPTDDGEPYLQLNIQACNKGGYNRTRRQRSNPSNNTPTTRSLRHVGSRRDIRHLPKAPNLEL